MFRLLKTKSKARLGVLSTRRGQVPTPVFMPIATKGAVKTLTSEELQFLAPEIILANTYHLFLRPGEQETARLGGLHVFMDWPGPILTDSGGFQVYSFAKQRKITSDGITFNSHLDGRKFFLSPEDSLRMQFIIGADIMMVLDECVALPASRDYLAKAVRRTTHWAQRAKVYCEQRMMRENVSAEQKPLLFSIVQGGLEQDLRLSSAQALVGIGFDGYAVGGLAVGESEQEMCSVLDYMNDILPTDKPRYLMGVGYPHQIIEAVKRGIDMFDCVIPTREARHGRLYYWRADFVNDRGLLALADPRACYSVTHIKNEKFKFDLSPISARSKFISLQKYSKAYLRHLFIIEDPLAWRLATLNNLEFYLQLMKDLRAELAQK